MSFIKERELESEVKTMAFEYLEQYSTFDSVADMDQHVEQHIQQHYFDLTESERAIVFTLASRSLLYPGASHLKAETIATTLEISTKTVYRSVKKLNELNIIEKVPGTKLNGIKGASIYRILPYVPIVPINVPTEVSERVRAVEVNNDVVHEPKSENQSSNSFNLLSSKQAKNNLTNLENELALQAEKKKAYMNEWQTMLYDFLHTMPFTDQLKDELHKLVLASQVDSVQTFHRAKDVIIKIACDIADGTLTVSRTLRAVFAGAYKAKVDRLDKQTCKVSTPVEQKHSGRPVPFYDWLNERESYTPAVSNVVDNKYLPNWLEW